MDAYDLPLCKPDLSMLCPAEQKRAAGYLEEAPRRRFITGRFLLRRRLGAILGLAPQDVVFRMGIFGKPETEGVFFSMSYSSEKMVLATSQEIPVGIDIEQCSEKVWECGMDALFLSEKERKIVADSPDWCRTQTRLSFWTAKEAFLKNMGWGLVSDLRKIDAMNQSYIVSIPIKGYCISLSTMSEVQHVDRHINRF